MKRHFWKTVNLLILIDNSIVQKFRNKAKKNGNSFQACYSPSSKGLILVSIASLALNILDRTVPTGQSMISAISS